jgi:3-oxoacyl-[acyl-carrier-protein] synthase II
VPLALAASREAITDSGIDPTSLSDDERQRFGVVLGTGGGGLSFTEKQFGFWFSGNAGKGSVYTIPASTHGGLSSELSMVFGLHGLSHIVLDGMHLIDRCDLLCGTAYRARPPGQDDRRRRRFADLARNSQRV